MEIKARLIGNQSKLKRGLNVSNFKIRLYVRDEPHYSGMSTRELAQLLSTGDDEEGIPARPFMKQFWSEHGQECKSIALNAVKEAIYSGTDAKTATAAVAAEIESLFESWVLSGGVNPPNSPYTKAIKGPLPALIDTGALLGSIKAEVENG